MVEPGSPTVDALLAGKGPHLVARPALVELPSAFAKKVRVGQLTRAGFAANILRMRADAAAKRAVVVPMTRRNEGRAVRLITAVGLGRNLLTLDALQLAVALRLRAVHPGLVFVSADQALLATAAGQGMVVAHV